MRKAQVQALEPIVIVIFLALLLGIALVFYFRISGGQVRQDESLVRSQENAQLLATVTRLPELSCTSDTRNCIDLYKAQAFAASVTDPRQRLFYYALFGTANISIQWVELSGKKELQLYNALQSENIRASRTYFTIQDPVTGHRHFATMTIEQQVGS